MPTVRRRDLGDFLPAPTPAAVVTALLAGAVFALVGLSVDRGGPVFPSAPAPRYQDALQQEQQRTTELLRKIEIEVAAPSRASLRAPVVTVREPRPAPVIAARPRVTPRRNVSAGIWSAAKERQRQLWRRWASSELRKRGAE